MKRKFIASLFLIGCAVTGFSQSGTLNNAASKSEVQGFAQEIYKNYPSYITPTLLSVFEEHYSRLELKQVPFSSNENYLLLSKTMLINKYNPDLKRENGQNFTPASFNPLKYALDFDAKEDKYYRIDGSDYIILIHKR